MNFNFHISRYTFLMIVVAAVFVLLVIKAFSYLPEDQSDAQLLQNAKNKLVDQNVVDDTSEEILLSDSVEEKNNTDNSEDKIDRLFEDAENYLEAGDYNNALSIYFNIVSMVNEPQKHAACYDGIAKIYSAQGKYDKAIDKAQLAYRYEPNDTRKVALLRLYHKTGDTVNEQNMLSEILEDNDN